MSLCIAVVLSGPYVRVGFFFPHCLVDMTVRILMSYKACRVQYKTGTTQLCYDFITFLCICMSILFARHAVLGYISFLKHIGF